MNEKYIEPAEMALGLEPAEGETSLPEFTGEVVPRSKWVTTTAAKRYVPRGKCQFTVPGCTQYTNVKMYQTKLAIAAGRPGWWPEISYCAAHQEITRGQMRQGSRAIDCIRLMIERGLVPTSPEVPEWYASPRPIPPSAQQDRVKFIGSEWEQITNVEQGVSLILNLDMVNVSIDWCERDTEPGPTGHLHMDAGRVVGGHSVLGCGLVMGYDKSPSGVGILFNNHHGDSKSHNLKNEFGQALRSGVWGDDGFGIVPIERWAHGIPRYSSAGLRTVKVADEFILA